MLCSVAPSLGALDFLFLLWCHLGFLLLFLCLSWLLLFCPGGFPESLFLVLAPTGNPRVLVFFFRATQANSLFALSCSWPSSVGLVFVGMLVVADCCPFLGGPWPFSSGESQAIPDSFPLAISDLFGAGLSLGPSVSGCVDMFPFLEGVTLFSRTSCPWGLLGSDESLAPSFFSPLGVLDLFGGAPLLDPSLSGFGGFLHLPPSLLCLP